MFPWRTLHDVFYMPFLNIMNLIDLGTDCGSWLSLYFYTQRTTQYQLTLLFVGFIYYILVLLNVTENGP